MRGSRRGRFTVVRGGKQRCHRSRWTLARCYIDHRTHKESDHVMEKPVRLDLEDPAAVALDPRCVPDDAAVVIVDRRRVGNGERPEFMFSQQHSRFVLQE